MYNFALKIDLFFYHVFRLYTTVYFKKNSSYYKIMLTLLKYYYKFNCYFKNVHVQKTFHF